MLNEKQLNAALKEMVNAHTSLTMFYAVIAMMESGCLPGASSHKTEARIIQLCLHEADRQLSRHDRARDTIRLALAKPGSGEG